MQNEALLGTYLLPQATMRTATLIAMHITSDKIHSLQVGCKSFEADYITGPEVDVAPKLRTDIFHSAQPLKSTSCSSSKSSTRARKESLRVRMYFTSWEISSANLCSPARYVLECIASISGYKEEKNEREQGQSLTNEKDRKICHSLGSGVVDFFSRLHCVRWGLGLLQGAGHCRQICWAAG